MLIIATRSLSKGRMQYGHTYEVPDEEGERLIAAGLARSGETLRDRDPVLAAELEELIAIPPTEILLKQGTAIDAEDLVGEVDVTL